MRLEGKTALVTGGSQGIGEAIAKRLAAEGASVAVVASSSPDKAEAVVASLPGAAGRHMATACDVRDAEAVRALVGAVEKRFGGIDTLVNSARSFLSDTGRLELRSPTPNAWSKSILWASGTPSTPPRPA